MITLQGVTKTYGSTTAVNDLSLAVRRGHVTGFLGPNGSGKSTTMRMILGLDHPTRGQALIDGRRYEHYRHPLRKVGALLDATAVHPGRSARKHLLAIARSNGIPGRRVEEVLDQVGLTDVAERRAGQYSLGMGQRLGIAVALLGDPELLMFDEPVNGLDPDGVLWIRNLMRSLAADGRTVFVSSHLMSEMQLTADHLVVIGRGRVIADAPVAEVMAASSRSRVIVRAPVSRERDVLHASLRAGGEVDVAIQGETLTVSGASVEYIGDMAHGLGVRLHQLQDVAASLEEAYMELTGSSVQYVAADLDTPPLHDGADRA
jgi:ABC-2 type transport system ATP-binding protein